MCKLRSIVRVSTTVLGATLLGATLPGCALTSPRPLGEGAKRSQQPGLTHPSEFTYGSLSGEGGSTLPVETLRRHDACKLNSDVVRLAWLDEKSTRQAFASVEGFPQGYEALGRWLIDQAAYLTRAHASVSQRSSTAHAVHDDLTQAGILNCDDNATKTGRYGLYAFKRELVFPALTPNAKEGSATSPIIGARGAGRTDEGWQPETLLTPRFQEPVQNNAETWHSTGLMTLNEAIRAVVFHRVLSKFSVWAQEKARAPLDQLRVTPVFAILDLGFDIRYGKVGRSDQRAAMLLYAPVPRATELQKREELKTNWSALQLFQVAAEQAGLALSVANITNARGAFAHVGASNKNLMEGLWLYDFSGFTSIEPSFESTIGLKPPQLPPTPWREKPRTQSLFDQAAVYAFHTAQAYLGDAPHDMGRARSHIYAHIAQMSDTLTTAAGWPAAGEDDVVAQSSKALFATPNAQSTR